MANQWYFTKSGAKFGPVTTKQLKQLATSTQISPADLIWKDDRVGWVSAGSVVGLFPPASEAQTSSSPEPHSLHSTSGKMQGSELNPALQLSSPEATEGVPNASSRDQIVGCEVKQIASGFKYGKSGFRSYNGPVLLDDKCIYMVVGANRIFGSNVGVDATGSGTREILLRLVFTLILRCVFSMLGNRLRHPSATTFCELPDNVRGQRAFGKLTPKTQIIVIPFATVKTLSSTGWLGRHFLIETDEATFELDLSKSEATAARVLFTGYGLFAKSNTLRNHDTSEGQAVVSEGNQLIPDWIRKDYLASLLPAAAMATRALRRAKASIGPEFKRPGWGDMIWYGVGLVAVYVYCSATAVAGVAAAKDMNIVPAVLYMVVPLLIVYGLVRLFRLRALGRGFLSGFATIGFVLTAGLFVALCGINEKAAAWLCWVPALLIVFPALTWFQFRAVCPDSSLYRSLTSDVAKPIRAQDGGINANAQPLLQAQSRSHAFPDGDSSSKPTPDKPHYSSRIVALAIAATLLTAFLAMEWHASKHRLTRTVNTPHLNISANSKTTIEPDRPNSQQKIDAMKMTEMGVRYFNGDDGVDRDYQQAMVYLRKGADGGDTRAYYCLGLAFNLGRGVAQDYGHAIDWFRKGADAGDANAMFCLGLSYAKAQGVPQDYQQALAWCTKAADAGNAGSMCEIGALYENGQGVTQDASEALLWFHKAADLGDQQAKQILGGLERLSVQSAETTGLASLGLTRDQCLICGKDRTAYAKTTFSDSRGFGLCEECGTQYQSYNQALKIGVQTGALPSDDDQLLVDQFTAKLQGEQNPAAVCLIPLFVCGQFATSSWNTLTAGK